MAAGCSKRWVTHDHVEIEGWEIEAVAGTVPVAPNLERLLDEHPDLRGAIEIIGRVADGPGEEMLGATYIDPARPRTLLSYSVTTRAQLCATWERVVKSYDASRGDVVARRKLGDRTWIVVTRVENDLPALVEYSHCHDDVLRSAMASSPTDLARSGGVARLERTLAHSRFVGTSRR